LKLISKGEDSAADKVTQMHKVSDKVSDSMWKVKVRVPLTWHQYYDLAKEQGGRLPRVSDLKRENIHVDDDCWTPIERFGGEKETGKRDGFFLQNENCWANVGPKKYQIQYPAWGLQKGESDKSKPRFFFMIRESLVGPPQDDGKGSATFEELGALLAKIHGVSPEWYEEYRKKLCKKYKGLDDVPEASYIWWNTARESLMPSDSGWNPKLICDGKTAKERMQWLMENMAKKQEDAQAQIMGEFPFVFGNNSAKVIRNWGKAGPRPASKVLSRVVTCHGDFHPANILRTKDGLKVIDMEYSCATFAVQDVAFAFALYVKGTAARRSFVSGYLQQLGISFGPEDVDELVVDAACCTIGTVFGLIGEHVKRACNDSQ